MSSLPRNTPFYGGGQVPNPANVIQISGSPPSVLTEDNLGTLAVDNSTASVFILASKSGGSDTWVQVASSVGNVTLNGNLDLNTAGNKLEIATGSNASAGQVSLGFGGAATVNTTAVTSSSLIFLSHASNPSVIGTLYVSSISSGNNFVIASDNAFDVSKVNWWIVN